MFFKLSLLIEIYKIIFNRLLKFSSNLFIKENKKSKYFHLTNYFLF